MVIIGGTMGLLAAYGLLVIIKEGGLRKFDEPKTTIVKTDNSPPIAPKPKSPSSRIRHRESEVTPPVERPHIRRKEPERPVAPKSPEKAPQNDDDLAFIAPRNHDQAPANVPPAINPFALPTPSAIVRLTLENPVVRVIVEPPFPVEELYCDVAFCPMLLPDPGVDDPNQHLLVEHKLGNRDRRLHELPLNLTGAGAAIEIAVAHQTKSAFCEIRPKFSLPVNGIEELTIARGERIRSKLEKLLSDADDFRRLLPGMNSELANLKTQMSRAQAAARLRSDDTVNALARRNAAIAAYNRLVRQADNKASAIARAEGVIANEPNVREELKLLEQVAAYSAQMTTTASIYVRFYNGSDVTVPGIVK